MKNSELNDLLTGLQNVKGLKGFKFAMVVSKNTDIVTKELKALEEAIAPPKEFLDYENKRIELCIAHSLKDNDGNPTIVEQKYVMRDKKKFNEAWEKLKKDNKKTLDAEDERLKEAEKFLENESEIELKMVSQDDIPDEISVEQVQGIKYMIEGY